MHVCVYFLKLFTEPIKDQLCRHLHSIESFSKLLNAVSRLKYLFETLASFYRGGACLVQSRILDLQFIWSAKVSNVNFSIVIITSAMLTLRLHMLK